MKKIKGIWLPDGDTHFGAHLARGPLHAGKGTYQLAKIQMALGCVARARHAIDVGAHVGLWSRVLAARFKRVTAIEPMPAAVECFRANLIGYRNVTLIEAAASDRRGDIALNPVTDNSGNAHVSPEIGGSSIQADAVRLDDLRLQDVDLLKIDVEGWELKVLAGAEKLILGQRPVIVIEQKPDNAERYGFARFEAVNLLRRWGARQLWEKSGDFCFGWRR